MINYEEKTVAQLVVIFQREQEDLAFNELCIKFRPLIVKQWKQFGNLQFSLEEWQQEMRVIMFESIMKYQGDMFNVTFGSFYKRAIRFRVTDEWRRRQTKRQRFRKDMQSLEASTNLTNLKLADVLVDNYNQKVDELIVLENGIEEFKSTITGKLEKIALKDVLGENDTSLHQEFDDKAIARARIRVLKKLEAYLD
ncbi:hypothetical protein [Periweissella beninensis]|uniref:Sigma-70 family RNA polymerase sigma factor n=1 Tax=Periweissella beninensis TaxID=504936 RepID=A0ABT0VGC4_9LACO|nr:hypothetical protein [Periweissella beninensis]MBM7544611.1 RNA polymerase sporulation-specific sigma factor [Periweissella beninensis]MCM2436878.1 hypothetical protein [Periweissella beninensis]MCT4395866.1 hypothetical protein [Periweissella beninensis]